MRKKNLRFRFFFHLPLFIIFVSYNPRSWYELRSKSMLISTPGSRFPRATLPLPRKQKSFPAGASAGTGTAHCSTHQKALLLFPEESPRDPAESVVYFRSGSSGTLLLSIPVER